MRTAPTRSCACTARSTAGRTRTGYPLVSAPVPDRQAKGIDDVPIVTVTLWSTDASQGTFELGQVAHAIETESRVPGTRDIYTIGATENVVAVELDPQARGAWPGPADWRVIRFRRLM